MDPTLSVTRGLEGAGRTREKLGFETALKELKGSEREPEGPWEDVGRAFDSQEGSERSRASLEGFRKTLGILSGDRRRGNSRRNRNCWERFSKLVYDCSTTEAVKLC